MDRYGYIGIETLLRFCENSKDHAVTPNDFMRMARVKMPRWVPVTEKLPEEDGTYIVCLEDGSVFEYGYITNWYDDAWEYCKKDVVAWMPRPEPYREEDRNEQRRGD